MSSVELKRYISMQLLGRLRQAGHDTTFDQQFVLSGDLINTRLNLLLEIVYVTATATNAQVMKP